MFMKVRENMRYISILAAIFTLILGANLAFAAYEENANTIKSELESKGVNAQVVYIENSTHGGHPAYVILINVSDGDYLTATRRAIVAAANEIYKSHKYTTDAIIGLIGPSDKAYQLGISYGDLVDIEFQGLCDDLDRCKNLAENRFDSSTVTTPQELKAYFGT
jgi:hypothetical protein